MTGSGRPVGGSCRTWRRFERTLGRALDPFGRAPRLDLDRSIASSVGVILV